MLKNVDLFERRRQAAQVEANTPQQRESIRFRGGAESFPL
jgi:hypothetical protein